MPKIIFIMLVIFSSPIFSQSLNLHSTDFKNNQEIPQIHTCKGQDLPPQLFWNSSKNIQTYVLIVDDPDAPNGDWVHWLVFNIPKEKNSLTIPNEFSNGKNSWGNAKYQGPCPPSGLHHYYFKLYGLDIQLKIKNPTKQDLLKAMQGHIINRDKLIGFVKH